MTVNNCKDIDEHTISNIRLLTVNWKVSLPKQCSLSIQSTILVGGKVTIGCHLQEYRNRLRTIVSPIYNLYLVEEADLLLYSF
jgi:hypothetical protein